MWRTYLLQDLRYALRLLRKTPVFTAAAVLILGCAIGSNLAVFSLIDALMLRAIPVAKPDELVRIDMAAPKGQSNGMPSTVIEALAQEPAFSGACGFITPRITTEIGGAIAGTNALSMTGDCFRTLGVTTRIGRPFTAADDLPEAPNVVVLTARFWHTTFGAEPDIVGRRIRAGSEIYTVIGVAADEFTGVVLGFEPGLILPLHHTPGDVPQRRYAWYWVTVFARRAPGIGQAAAAARLQTIAPALLAQSVPPRYNEAQRLSYLANHLTMSSARTGIDWMLRSRFGPPLYALWGICAAILLIAVLNVAGLLVARTLARQKEIEIRLAIGAGRWRVIRPLALESLLLSAAGGAAGILLASWAGNLIVSQASVLFGDLAIDTSPGIRGLALLGRLRCWYLPLSPRLQRGSRIGRSGVFTCDCPAVVSSPHPGAGRRRSWPFRWPSLWRWSRPPEYLRRRSATSPTCTSGCAPGASLRRSSRRFPVPRPPLRRGLITKACCSALKRSPASAEPASPALRCTGTRPYPTWSAASTECTKRAPRSSAPPRATSRPSGCVWLPARISGATMRSPKPS